MEICKNCNFKTPYLVRFDRIEVQARVQDTTGCVVKAIKEFVCRDCAIKHLDVFYGEASIYAGQLIDEEMAKEK